jgi:hypothetical protein
VAIRHTAGCSSSNALIAQWILGRSAAACSISRIVDPSIFTPRHSLLSPTITARTSINTEPSVGHRPTSLDLTLFGKGPYPA